MFNTGSHVQPYDAYSLRKRFVGSLCGEAWRSLEVRGHELVDPTLVMPVEQRAQSIGEVAERISGAHFADRLRKAAKTHTVIIIALARKLVTIANALCNICQKWVAPTT